MNHMPTPPAELTERMPAWYIPHGGGPCFFKEWNPPDAWNQVFSDRLMETTVSAFIFG